MRFAEPHILHWLWLLPVLVVSLYWLYARRQKISIRFIGRGTNEGTAKEICLAVAFVFIVLALARPQWGYEMQKVKHRGLDILLAVDVSKSMLTQDVKPSRLGRTKLAVKDLLKKLKGDRIGLIAFAGEAFLTCPLTSDYNGFLLATEDLSQDVIPRGGTNIAKAIEEAVKSFSSSAEHKAFVLVTDGEEEQGDAAAVARKAKEKDIKIYTVGIGTQEGDLVRVLDEQGQEGFLKDKQGNFIKSRLNERLLQEIAYITGGAYVRSSGAQFGLDYLYDQQLSHLTKRDLGEQEDRKYHERFQWPLAVAVLLLLAATLWPSQKRNMKKVFLLIVISYVAFPSMLWAEGINEANHLYHQGRYDEAVHVYQKAADANAKDLLARYNLGTALYKEGEFDKSTEYLQQSLTAVQAPLRLKAQYNLGNALYKAGMAKEEKNIDGAIASLEKSLHNYDEVIKTDAKDQDARYNRDIVQKELERLKKKKQEQKQQQQQQKKDKQEKDKGQQEGQDQQGSQQEEQQKKDQQQGQEGQEEKPGKQEQDGEADRAEDLSAQQAEKLLKEYERTDAPLGLLNFIPRKGKEQDVEKDW